MDPEPSKDSQDRRNTTASRARWAFLDGSPDASAANGTVPGAIYPFRMVARGIDVTGVTRTALVRRARKIDRVLAETYPEAKCELDFDNPFELLVVTDEHQFQDLDKASLGLRAVHTEVWEDLVFVNVDAQPRESLGAWLGELADDYDGYFARHQRASSTSSRSTNSCAPTACAAAITSSGGASGRANAMFSAIVAENSTGSWSTIPNWLRRSATRYSRRSVSSRRIRPEVGS